MSASESKFRGPFAGIGLAITIMAAGCAGGGSDGGRDAGGGPDKAPAADGAAGSMGGSGGGGGSAGSTDAADADGRGGVDSSSEDRASSENDGPGGASDRGGAGGGMSGPDGGGRDTGGMPSATDGIWISRAELMARPMSGPAWDSVLKASKSSAGTPDLSNQDQDNNVLVMAKALVSARTGDEALRAEVRKQCLDAMGTEAGGRTLALGRELAAYVIAADLVKLEPNEDAMFRTWLKKVLTETLDGMTLVGTNEKRPNNWGTHAGASRIAVARYLGDKAELDRAAKVFKGWLGDRASYSSFTFGELDWQADPANPVGINPAGATKSGHSIDGVLPEEMRRAGTFTWPPPKENYVWGALAGALAQAVMLHRAGFDVWNWQDKALFRAGEWVHKVNDFPASGDDNWQPHLFNHYYGTSYPAPMPSTPGKNLGWTDWTHGK